MLILLPQIKPSAFRELMLNEQHQPEDIMLPHDDIDPEIIRRISDAADQLFNEGGHNAVPSVDAVRRRARANMNHASLVMRTWRQQLKAQPGPTEELMPESLRHIGNQLMLNIWREATKTASTHLASAKAAWEEERGELEEFRRQLSTAFDAQSRELQESTTALATLRTEGGERTAACSALEQRTIEAETAHIGSERVLRQAQEEILELRKLLVAAQAAQERITQQLQEQLRAQVAAAERHLAEQKSTAEQLGQLRQEAGELRARLAQSASPLPSPQTKTSRRQNGKPPPTQASPAPPQGE